jgi:transposase InsO family protein/transposase-like protein
MSKKKVTSKSKEQGRQGRRFTKAQKDHALLLVASGGMSREAIAKTVVTTTESLRRWVAVAKEAGSMPKPPVPVAATKASAPTAPKASVPRSPYAPADPAQGLGEHEVAAILELKRSHPSMGPAQLRAQFKRFNGWRLSLKAIARVLRGHGYELVHRGSKPKGPEPTRFEAPRRNALWQADYTEVRVGGDKLHVLVVLDDFSRYIVGHAIADSPSSQVATNTFRHAIARHGKPEAVRTDRGGGFIAFSKETDFGRFLEAELIDHIVGKSYRPRGGGKVESANGTLKRELWELEHFDDRAHATERLRAFFEEYNERRAHMGIDGLTPADRFFGRADKVLAAVDAISRRRQGALSLVAGAGGAVEEAISAHDGAPLEVLRLVLVDGVMELRFCGARVRLGRVET